MLYENHLYLNKNIDYIISHEIIEYDIRSAGYNIIKYYNLLPQKYIDVLENLDKKEKQIQIGKYQRDFKGFSDELTNAFTMIRGEFFDKNDIKDDEVLAIKKDAIILLRRCDNLTFGNIEFVNKNEYSSYFHINDLEFYVNNMLTLKGLGENALKLHKEYMLDTLAKILKSFEICNRKVIVNNVVKFADLYKSKELHDEYYRELNNDSLFRYKIDVMGNSVGMDTIDSLDNIDISYNYLRYIVPLINIII